MEINITPPTLQISIGSGQQGPAGPQGPNVVNAATPLAYSSLSNASGAWNLAVANAAATGFAKLDLSNIVRSLLGSVDAAAARSVLGVDPAGTVNYTLPTASGLVLGGVKVGSNLSIDGAGVLTVASAPAGSLTGTTLAANVTQSSLTTLGTVTAAGNVALLNAANTFSTGPQVMVGGATVRQSGGTPGLNELQVSHGGSYAMMESKNGYIVARAPASGSYILFSQYGASNTACLADVGLRLPAVSGIHFDANVIGSGIDTTLTKPATGQIRLSRLGTNGSAGVLSLAGPSSNGTLRDVAVLTGGYATQTDATFQGSYSVGVYGIVGSTPTLQTGLTVTAASTGLATVTMPNFLGIGGGSSGFYRVYLNTDTAAGIGGMYVNTTSNIAAFAAVNSTSGQQISLTPGSLFLLTPLPSTTAVLSLGSSGTVLYGWFDSYGTFSWAGGASSRDTWLGRNSGAAGVIVSTTSPSAVVFTVKGAASQSADLTQWQNSSGTVGTCVGSDANLIARAITNGSISLKVVSAGASNNPVEIWSPSALRRLFSFQNGGVLTVDGSSGSGAVNINTDRLRFVNTTSGYGGNSYVIDVSVAAASALYITNTFGNGSGTSGSNATSVIIDGGNFQVNNKTASLAVATLQGAASQTGNMLELWGVTATPANRIQAAITTAWIDPTDATRTGRLSLGAYYTTTFQEGLRIDAQSAGYTQCSVPSSFGVRATTTGTGGNTNNLAALLIGEYTTADHPTRVGRCRIMVDRAGGTTTALNLSATAGGASAIVPVGNSCDWEFQVASSSYLSVTSSGNYLFRAGYDGTNRVVKIGDSGARVGLFGAAPVAQPTALGTTTGFTAGAGSAVLHDSTFTGGTGASAYTMGDVVRALKNLGVLAA